ncbi:hypothetical protein SSX86_001161 [Deinandra increscens subsp. villosa]|uniref:Polygalacturonase n=1 Tax=Deinandra increscens subsp. villosa TaxID=3103831 RepID=A0AAP0DR43_9ASTR
MGNFLMIALLSFYYISFSPPTASGATFDVMSYGAKGDGNTDDAMAFMRAWAGLCRDKSPNPTLVIPPKFFLISPVTFSGPCKSPAVHVQLLGNIVAPKTLAGWKGCAPDQIWISFTSVQGLTITGPGMIHGRGSLWWGNQGATQHCKRPKALHFNNCNGLRLSGTTHADSPGLHISIVNCHNVDLGHLRILAPANSPNTDGIDLSSSSQINIHHSNIQTGDDCVAINGGIYDMNVTWVFCGPGHGISIGSLGENGKHDTVEKVRIQHCNITGTTNGLRIKTVPGGTGYARGIIYQDINLVNVENPIIIDQHYCTNAENSFCPSPPSDPAVQVSNVMYLNIHGSSASKQAITFNCSGKYKCTGIITDQVAIYGVGDFSYCKNANGKFISTNPIGFFVVVLLSFCYILFSPKTASAAIFDIKSYGAKGDGTTDDSQAFLKAWAGLCEDTSPTLIIPSGMTFLISPVLFNGSSCKFSNLNIQLSGSITAPKTLEGWKNCPQRRFWIHFSMVQRLTIEGPGRIDGQGSVWWRVKETTETCDRPTALHFSRCPGLRLKGTTHINSPFLHISIDGCQDVDIGNLHIIAPENSPNTDGIDIGGSSHVHIHDSNIQTGDDCVAINGGVVDINVTNVDCGPGHGISIGSLGENMQHDTVEQVRVQNCNITGTQNGLRIKTVPNGTGYARGIRFQDINLVNVGNPIIIDQHYCNGNISSSDFDNHVCPPQPSAEAVKVSDVTYTNIHGSSPAKQAIVFDCSEKYNCTGIVTNNVHITGGGIAYCKNTQGQFVDTTPNVSCG